MGIWDYPDGALDIIIKVIIRREHEGQKQEEEEV